ncbi:SusC/RagA family TonB-linked outer membrane protein [Maribacter sp. X9]|uniref:SusC/RagA family TonB-linked outer membrane protein n=1 Tax=Maribacter sp. X9 TaxID=3402159 RepID=UPI003AF34AD4
MKAFIFLCCSVVLGLSPKTSFSQDADILVSESGRISIKSMLHLIHQQSNYRFIYNNDLIKEAPSVNLEKGTIKASQLLQKTLNPIGLTYEFTNDRTIHIKRNTTDDQELKTDDDRKIIQFQVSGTITDGSGQPLPGANVIEKGTKNGTQADFDGQFELFVKDQFAVLIISYIGYDGQEIALNGKSEISTVLIENTESLDEVVVIGFGTKRKKDLTGSVSVVNTADIEKSSFASPQFALQGNTAGVRVINSSGDPNSPPEIYVRGIGSWQGNAQPLYVIDGQIITPPSASGNLDLISRNGSSPPPNLFTMINPDDIESITVLKDASSAAIYGSRGANGVILITTKKGKKGAPTVEFTSRTGFQNIDTFKMQNTSEFRALAQEIYANNQNPNITIENQLYGRDAADDVIRRTSFSPQFDPTSQFYIGSEQTYDWQDDLVKRNAVTMSYDFKVSGAGENTDYYVSSGYDNIESNLVGNNLETYRTAININSRITSWLKVGVNYKFAYQNQDIEDLASLTTISQTPPWQPIFDPSNQFGYAEVMDTTLEDWQQAKIYGQGTRDNYLALRDLNRRVFENTRHLGQGYIELLPFKGLTLRSSVNLDYTAQDRIYTSTYRGNIFKSGGQDPATDSASAPNSLGAHESRNNYIYNYQFDFSATYEKSFGEHKFIFTGAVQDQFQRTQTKSLSGENLTNIKDLKRIQYSNDLANNSSFIGWNERFWLGYVGRLSYSFSDKYYLDGSFRRDASSGFAKDYRWGNFYSVSGAWRMSGEKFMDNVKFVNDLKFRGGYGEAGNDEVAAGRYAYLSTAGGAGSYRLGSGSGDALGDYYIAASLNSLPNKSLVWEVAKTSYVGLDATLFDYKLNLALEVYKREQVGIQQTVNLPLSVGTSDPLFNVGKLENRGVDIQLGFNDRKGDFNYGISTNISFLENEVTEIYNDQPLYATNQFQRTYRVEKGRSLGHIWGYKVGGIFQSQEEIDAFYAATPDATVQDVSFVGPGDMYFQDVHGDPTEEERFYTNTPDGKINTNDQTEIGNTIPGYTYGINLNLGYKGFDISASFYGEGDVDKYNYARASLERMSSAGLNYGASVSNRWTPSNTDTDMPRAVVGDPAGNNRFSDRFVESAAFFRLNNWQLGYSVPRAFLDKINNPVGSFRLYVGGQNNIYINKWKGLDPTNDEFPLPKSYVIGLKATF